jgi:hypothetical protein
MILKFLNDIKSTKNKISNVSSVDFDLTNTEQAAKGSLVWNQNEGTLDLGLSPNKSIYVGEESVYRVRNNTGSLIPKGTALYASGVQPSGRIEVSPYVADGQIREVRFMGLATENINSGINGFVQHFGYIEDIDTRGISETPISVGDEDWVAGDILYVHPTVAGKLTNIKPQHAIIVALLIVRHQSSGILFVRPSSGGHIEDIHDISINEVQDGDILSYDTASSTWKNKPLSSTIDINASDVSYDNTGTDLNATTVQGAINELYTLIQYTSGFYIDGGLSNSTYDTTIDAGSSTVSPDAIILNGGGS